jgi:hypothetical protein
MAKKIGWNKPGKLAALSKLNLVASFAWMYVLYLSSEEYWMQMSQRTYIHANDATRFNFDNAANLPGCISANYFFLPYKYERIMQCCCILATTWYTFFSIQLLFVITDIVWEGCPASFVCKLWSIWMCDNGHWCLLAIVSFHC